MAMTGAMVGPGSSPGAILRAPARRPQRLLSVTPSGSPAGCLAGFTLSVTPSEGTRGGLAVVAPGGVGEQPRVGRPPACAFLMAPERRPRSSGAPRGPRAALGASAASRGFRACARWTWGRRAGRTPRGTRDTCPRPRRRRSWRGARGHGRWLRRCPGGPPAATLRLMAALIRAEEPRLTEALRPRRSVREALPGRGYWSGSVSCTWHVDTTSPDRSARKSVQRNIRSPFGSFVASQWRFTLTGVAPPASAGAVPPSATR